MDEKDDSQNDDIVVEAATTTSTTASSSVILFSGPLLNLVASERLPPNYVGVRRVRPSSRVVQQALLQESGLGLKRNQPVVYKVSDPKSGVERRMTSQEKKALKLKLRKEREMERKLARKQFREKQKEQREEEKKGRGSKSQNDDKPPPPPQLQPTSTSTGMPCPSSLTAATFATKGDDRYVQLDLDYSALEMELADLRGERNTVPPVVLSPPLARIAAMKNLLPGREKDIGVINRPSGEFRKLRAVFDEELSTEWAHAMKASMAPAERVRNQEDMRPMAYDIVPQLWTRMRPELVGTKDIKESAPSTTAVEAAAPDESSSSWWSFCEVRPAVPATSAFDAASDAVVEILHRGTNLHASCGAKFGCDFLLYDGPREERHAFAGLRVLVDAGRESFPLPRAYDMAGFVRCLNTAGKLALMATAKEDGALTRVAIVDLALERTEASANRRRRKTLEDRYKNLAKK